MAWSGERLVVAWEEALLLLLVLKTLILPLLGGLGVCVVQIFLVNQVVFDW
jgi:hypothetical protein